MENAQKGQKLEGIPGADDMQANLMLLAHARV